MRQGKTCFFINIYYEKKLKKNLQIEKIWYNTFIAMNKRSNL